MTDDTGTTGTGTTDTGAKCPFGFGATPASPGTGTGSDPAPEPVRHMSMPLAMKREHLPDLVRAEIQPGQDGLPTGRCLCGKVSFQIKRPVGMVFANHDPVSRRRSGGVAMTIMIRARNTVFNGWGHLVNYPASDRDVSCFCRVCGSPVLVRHVAPAAMDGMISLSAGLLDQTDGLTLAADLCHDEKPGYYAFEGQRRVINADDIARMFAAPRD